MTLTLEVLVSDQTQNAADGVYRVPRGTEVTVRAKADGDQQITDPVWLLDGNPWMAAEGIVDSTTDNGRPSRTFAPDGKYDKPITVQARVGGQEVTSNPVTLGTLATPDGGNGDNGQVSEVAAGEYDPHFTLLAGIFLGLALSAVMAAGWLSSASLLPLDEPLPVPTGGASVAALDSTQHVATRTKSLVQVATLFAGILCVAVGAFLAALEARGRLRRDTSQPVETIRGPLGELVNLLEPLRRMRGTAIAFGLGAVLILASLFTVTTATLVVDPAPSASLTPSPTSTTAASSTTSPSPSPRVSE